MKKNYVVDTNIFLNDPNCITVLRNGIENNVYIPYRVILELDKLKTDPKVNHLVARAVEQIRINLDAGDVQILNTNENISHPDLNILNEIKNQASIEDPILITNDKIFQLLSKTENIKSEAYINSYPYLSESQIYTGFITSPEDNKEDIKNYFVWEDGKPVFYKHKSDPKVIDYLNEAWKVTPKIPMPNSKEKDVHQNLALELLLDDDIHLVSLQGEAGSGKSFISLAAAFQKVLQEKKYETIVLIKPNVEVGIPIGFLPGEIDDKLGPYYNYLDHLVSKLNDLRNANRIFINGNKVNGFDPKKFNLLPINFLRGYTIENSFVIIDEAQNIPRDLMRTILSRMGQNTKVVLLGDTQQVDATFLNTFNNGLNWVVKLFKSHPIYAHMVLKGGAIRGVICEAVNKVGL